MPKICNCGKKRKYLVTKNDGTTEMVDTLTAAMNVIRVSGGRYQLVKA